MKEKGRLFSQVYVVFIISILVLSLVSVRRTSETETFTENKILMTPEIETMKTPSYIIHEPLSIIGNSDFVLLGIPGSGTVVDPYIIEGYSITSDSDSDAIYISNTNVYFVIRNCILTSTISNSRAIYLNRVFYGSIYNNTFLGQPTTDYTVNGVYLVDCATNLFENNTFSGFGTSIEVSSSATTTIANNTFSYNSQDVFIWDALRTSVANNSFSANVYMYDSTLTDFESNNFSGSGWSGLVISSSDDVMIVNNSFFERSDGIVIDWSTDITMTQNVFEDNGLSLFGYELDHWQHSISTDNLVNGKPIGYFWNQENSTIDGSQYGQIFLANSNNMTVENGTFMNVSAGIKLAWSQKCTLTNNTISGVRMTSLDLFYSPQNIIRNNTISNNTIGIHLESSSNNIIENNTISDNNSSCLELYGSPNCTVVNNLFYGNDNGVELFDSRNTSLFSNVFDYAGVAIDGWDLASWYHNITTDNIVNGKPLGYFWSQDVDTIDGSLYGQVILANCTSVTVNNGIFNNITHAIQLGYSRYCTLSNNTFFGNSRGIVFSLSPHNIIMNNTMKDSYAGFFLEDSYNSTLTNNTITRNIIGGYLQNSDHSFFVNNTVSENSAVGVYFYYSWSCTIASNDISDNSVAFAIFETADCHLISNTFENNGIYIDGWSLMFWSHTIGVDNHVNGKPIGYFWSQDSSTIDVSSYGQVILANCTNVTAKNGVFTNSSLGIQLGFSTYCTLRNNTISGNSYGIRLSVSSENILERNTLIENDYGMYIDWQSQRNLIYLNIFAYNEMNAFDMDGTNYWNSSVAGNYWSDYNGTGVHHLGWGSTDYHPFIYPGESIIPTINNIEDLNIEEDTGNSSIVWIPSDEFPSHYALYKDGLLVVVENWDGSIIAVNVSSSDLGIYNFTLVVYDKSGNSISDTVLVSVVDITSPTINSPQDIEYIVGTTGYNFTWILSDSHPSTYVVYKNGTEIESGSWNDTSVYVSVEGLDVGTHNYTIVAFDTSGNRVSDTVLVTVLSETLAGDDDILFVALFALSVVIEVAVAIVIIRKIRLRRMAKSTE